MSSQKCGMMFTFVTFIFLVLNYSTVKLNINLLEYDYVEANILKLHLEVLNSTFIIIFLYRSPSNNIHEFQPILVNVVKCSNGYITTDGDMNINIIVVTVMILHTLILF